MSLNTFSKLIGCNIYGSIRVSATALRIINTPEFQRLRNIKQLGLCYQVYPAAMHTRFEHSLGVYHLAGKMVEKLQLEYPEREYDVPEFGGKVKLTNLLGECIKIAGLCHDLGHGPFSHIFDDILLRDSSSPNKEHEIRSCLILEMLCKRELANQLDVHHINFIKSLINPSHEHHGALYQIVSNHLNGIDVDKFDYIVRDSRNLGLSTSFNPQRLINEFIIDENGNIAYPKHCSLDIFELFHSRYMMHKKVYSHKTVKLIECMLTDIFLKIDPIFKISESINDMNTFCRLTDNSIFHYMDIMTNVPDFIKINVTPLELAQIKDAYNIYQNIISRNLYKQVVEIAEDARDFLQRFQKYLLDKHSDLSANDFQIIRTKIGFVSGNKPDPFATIYFYNKKEDNHSFTLDKSHISGLINNNIQEIHTHLVCKNTTILSMVMYELRIFSISNK